MAVPEIGGQIVQWLQAGASVADCAAKATKIVGEDVDVADFLADLEAAGVLTDDENPPTVAVAPVGRTVGRIFFGPVGLAVQGVLVVVGLVLLALDPTLRPSYRDGVPSTIPLASIFIIMTVSMVLTIIHELAHKLAAARLGVHGRISFGRRLFFIVAQTDVTGLWAISPKKRAIPLAAGILIDAAISAAMVIVQRIWGAELGSPATEVVRAVVFINVGAIVAQTAVYMRTDFYALFLVMTGSKNLWVLKGAIARQLIRRGSDADRELIAAAGSSEVFWARCYLVLYVPGVIIATWYYFVFRLPATIRLIVLSASAIVDAKFSLSFAAVGGVLALLLIVVPLSNRPVRRGPVGCQVDPAAGRALAPGAFRKSFFSLYSVAARISPRGPSCGGPFGGQTPRLVPLDPRPATARPIPGSRCRTYGNHTGRLCGRARGSAMDATGLIDLQRKAADALLGAEDSANVLISAGQLARALRELSADNELWGTFEAVADAAPARQQLALVVSLDWPAILDTVLYRSPPPTELVASELAAVTVRTGEPPPWADLRERLRWLGATLGDDVLDPATTGDHLWWRRLQERVGFGWDAVRRINLVTVLIDGMVAEVAPWRAAFGSEPEAFSVMGTAVVGMLDKVASELRTAGKADEIQHQELRLQEISDGTALEPARAGWEISGLQAIGGQVDAYERTGWPADTANVFEQIQGIRAWAASVGVEMATAWGFVAAHAGAAGISYVNSLADALATLRRWLTRLTTGLREHSGTAVRAAAAQASAAIDAVMTRIREFKGFLYGEMLILHRQPSG
ncbi:hypothetical protein [Fodinicola feengrottensis]|nr:hypothetical protein [Fodinicola feengrottensis]